MSHPVRIQSALVSVFDKTGLEPVILALQSLGVTLYSTGGTQAALEGWGASVVPVEQLTDYPAILGGRVKTLHPKVFGGILGRRAHAEDQAEMGRLALPAIDLVIVDLYPFEATVAQGAEVADIIEKIDIGGISLIRAAAKNHQDVVVIPSQVHYAGLLELLTQRGGVSTLEERQFWALEGFRTSAHYDVQIQAWMAARLERPPLERLLLSVPAATDLRYGENPHQAGRFFGPLADCLETLHGKTLSYNNLLDVDAAVSLIAEFQHEGPTFAILKHNNACGCATRPTLEAAFLAALETDPVSAFGGVLIANAPIDGTAAAAMAELFSEVVIAPDFTPEALAILTLKKNRILLRHRPQPARTALVRSAINGYLVQTPDTTTETASHLTCVTAATASPEAIADALFALKVAKHTRSNTIVLAKDGRLLASGTGQTSRVDALRQAIEKARSFGFGLQNATLASDAFFPFPDCVEIAGDAGITTVIQPGGSIKDDLSIAACDARGMAMYTTGIRHFKH
jgi:phosphoribosylaminoimidazolecarboxamide formyltransferase/IMP cyclohydrolase